MTAAKMPFGKHEGQPLTEVRGDYLEWLLNDCKRLRPWLREAVKVELDRRIYGDDSSNGKGPSPRQETPGTAIVDVRSVVRSWYREMSLKYHPDRGGRHEVMVAINHAHDRLKELAGVA